MKKPENMQAAYAKEISTQLNRILFSVVNSWLKHSQLLLSDEYRLIDWTISLNFSIGKYKFTFFSSADTSERSDLHGYIENDY